MNDELTPMLDSQTEYVSIPKDEYESLKTIAYGMRAAARYMRVGRTVDFQRAMADVMDAINKEDSEKM